MRALAGRGKPPDGIVGLNCEPVTLRLLSRVIDAGDGKPAAPQVQKAEEAHWQIGMLLLRLPPHGLEHSPQAVSFQTVGLVQVFRLQDFSRSILFRLAQSSSEVGCPLLDTHVAVRLLVPPPHSAEQLLQLEYS
jgi:hypothetical protein